MRTSTTCTVCNHSSVSEIDSDIRSGTQMKIVARRFGLSYDAVKRHNRRHLIDGQVGPNRRRTRSPGKADELQVLQDVIDYMRGVDMDALTPAQRINHTNTVRAAAHSLAELRPPKPPPVVDVAAVEGLNELMGVIYDVLEPHPAIRKELAEAIKSHLA